MPIKGKLTVVALGVATLLVGVANSQAATKCTAYEQQVAGRQGFPEAGKLQEVDRRRPAEQSPLQQETLHRLQQMVRPVRQTGFDGSGNGERQIP
ncbi:hypothetical protein [Mesorhizobium sp. NPDC059025]|uniref:hypothetical protein n=1 Tax=unclassified Mesorhizobium TaxID=325217 RepID=UPI0036757DC0